MELIQALKKRYAAKRMNSTPVDQSKIDQIIEAIHLSPSSYGLQPYELIVISDKQLKQKIKPIANNQPQIEESSHLIVFAAWDQYTEERIKNVFKHLHKVRSLEDSASDEYIALIRKKIIPMSLDDQSNHTAKQAYIGFGIGLAAAAELGVDATPMEGFNMKKLDEFLGLESKNLKSCLIIALGNKDKETDWAHKEKKVRKPIESFVQYL